MVLVKYSKTASRFVFRFRNVVVFDKHLQHIMTENLYQIRIMFKLNFYPGVTTKISYINKKSSRKYIYYFNSKTSGAYSRFIIRHFHFNVESNPIYKIYIKSMNNIIKKKSIVHFLTFLPWNHLILFRKPCISLQNFRFSKFKPAQ